MELGVIYFVLRAAPGTPERLVFTNLSRRFSAQQLPVGNLVTRLAMSLSDKSQTPPFCMLGWICRCDLREWANNGGVSRHEGPSKKGRGEGTHLVTQNDPQTESKKVELLLDRSNTLYLI